MIIAFKKEKKYVSDNHTKKTYTIITTLDAINMSILMKSKSTECLLNNAKQSKAKQSRSI